MCGLGSGVFGFECGRFGFGFRNFADLGSWLWGFAKFRILVSGA